MAWGLGEENKEQREKNKEVLIDNYDTLVATFEEQMRGVQRDKDIYQTSIIPVVDDMGLGNPNDPNYTGTILKFKKMVTETPRFGETTIAKLMWKITDQVKELNSIQLTYSTRLDIYIKAMKIMLKSSFEMIKKLEGDKRKLQGFLGSRTQTVKEKPSKDMSSNEVREEVIKMLSNDMTQEQIAKTLGLHQTSVSHIKRKYYDVQVKKPIINEWKDVINKEEIDEDKKNINENQVYSPTTPNQNSENTLKKEEKDTRYQKDTNYQKESNYQKDTNYPKDNSYQKDTKGEKEDVLKNE